MPKKGVNCWWNSLLGTGEGMVAGEEVAMEEEEDSQTSSATALGNRQPQQQQ